MHVDKRRPLITFLAASALAAALPAQAEGWKHEFAPYLFGAGMDGKVGVRDVTADVDVNFGDILSNLKLGVMGAYRGSKDRYFVQVDAMYVKLEGDNTGPNGLVFGDATVKQTMLETDFGYMVTDRIGVFAGARYNKLDADVSATGPLGNTLSSSKSKDWVDPLIGARVDFPLSPTWSASLRGDIGGFDVGSKFAWQAVAALRWKASERTSVIVAYRYLDVNYEDGSGASFFKFDVAESGPLAGMVFTF